METTPADFRILPLKRDRDAFILLGLAALIALLVVVGLAFLPDKAWHRLEDRSQLLWGALVSILPVLLLSWQRLKLRRAAISALGKAASAPLTIEAPMGEPIYGVLSHAENHEGGEPLPPITNNPRQ